MITYLHPICVLGNISGETRWKSHVGLQNAASQVHPLRITR
jgi:hypothetical protein